MSKNKKPRHAPLPDPPVPQAVPVVPVVEEQHVPQEASPQPEPIA